nr:reverse transcriptase [Tanacetum cinerariifolium]
TMAPATRTNSTTTKEILASLREPIAQLIREEMQKLREEMSTTAVEVTTNQLGRNQSDQRQNMQFPGSPRLNSLSLEFMRPLESDIVPWLVYRGAIMQRFGNSFDDPLGELKNCKYENSMADYQNNFDKLLSRVDIREDQAISFYMAGLPIDIKLAVRMFKPQTLSVAYSLSKLQIESNEATKKKNKAPLFPTPNFNSYTSGGNQISSTKPLALPAPNVNWRNKAATPQVGLVSIAGGKTLVSTNICPDFVWKLQGKTFSASMMTLSLGGCDMVLGGTTKPVVQWMNGKQAGKIRNQASNLAMYVYLTAMLNMLSASVPTTENIGMPNTPYVLNPLIEEFADVFEVPNCLPPKRGLDHKIPLKEGTQPINMRPYRHPSIKLAVRMFKPQTLSVAYSLSKLQIESNEATKKKNKAPLFPTPNFNSYTSGGNQISSTKPLALPAPNVNWRNKAATPQVGLGTTKPVVQWMNGKQAGKIRNQASNLAMYVYLTAMLNMLSASVPTTENIGMPNTPYVLNPLIEEFADVFEVPNCLPPKRGLDHKIPLKEGTQPINMRPYRHPSTQKDAIESMVKELLDSGVIRHSQISFSSPTVMVKKKDRSWRMYIDYKQLNKQIEIFIIETDASGIGIGVVLQQKGHLISFRSKTLAPKHQVLSTYEKEFLAVIQALEKWRGYLLDRHFVIETNHYSLNELYDKIKKGWSEDSQLKEKIEKLQINSGSSKHYSWSNGQLLRKGKLVISSDESLKKELMQHFHNGPTGGHSRMQATTRRMGALMY